MRNISNIHQCWDHGSINTAMRMSLYESVFLFLWLVYISYCSEPWPKQLDVFHEYFDSEMKNVRRTFVRKIDA